MTTTPRAATSSCRVASCILAACRSAKGSGGHWADRTSCSCPPCRCRETPTCDYHIMTVSGEVPVRPPNQSYARVGLKEMKHVGSIRLLVISLVPPQVGPNQWMRGHDGRFVGWALTVTELGPVDLAERIAATDHASTLQGRVGLMIRGLSDVQVLKTKNPKTHTLTHTQTLPFPLPHFGRRSDQTGGCRRSVNWRARPINNLIPKSPP